MNAKLINADLLLKMLISGVHNLANHKEEINSLNVFPVPDGDTGSNMSMTAVSGINEIGDKEFNTPFKLMSSFARGLLLGARGNSGVIFSQIFKGFSLGIKEENTELNVVNFNACLLEAKKSAYAAVMKPVEGTILTVIREVGESLIDKINQDMTFDKYFELLIKAAKKSVNNTPNLLPVLKDVGVVDSGGQGLLLFFIGMQKAFLGKPIKNNSSIITKIKAKNQKNKDNLLKSKTLSGNFGYCTEFVVIVDDLKKLSLFNKDRYIKDLEKLGTSIVVVSDDNIIKTHIHSKKPGNVLNLSQKIGYFKSIKIDNMTLQVSENQHEHEVEVKANISKESTDIEALQFQKRNFELENALIVVANGQGIIEEFKNTNANYVVSGGQTMNPSAKDFINAIAHVNAKTVYILPNNSNIILAAEQAAAVEKRSKVIVIPTRTIMQGILAAMYFNNTEKLKVNRKNMRQAIKTVASASITMANKNTTYKRFHIKEGQYLGIIEKEISVVRNSILDTAKRLLKKMITKDSEIVTLFYGKDTNLETANQIQLFIEETYDIEVEVKQGDQPIYHFVIGVE